MAAVQKSRGAFGSGFVLTFLLLGRDRSVAENIILKIFLRRIRDFDFLSIILQKERTPWITAGQASPADDEFDLEKAESRPI